MIPKNENSNNIFSQDTIILMACVRDTPSKQFVAKNDQHNTMCEYVSRCTRSEYFSGPLVFQHFVFYEYIPKAKLSQS